MYILKNAWRSVVRSKGRNILIGVIVLVIAVSSCVALSIRQAAENVRESSMESLEITAQISVNRQAMMSQMQDRESMRQAMVNMEGLSLEEMEQYADSEYVKSFYYTASASMNAGGELEAIDTTGVTETESADSTTALEGDQNMGGFGGDRGYFGAESGGMKGGRMGIQGDFTVTGYSSDEAMTAFVNGSSTITDGAMFAENDTDMGCVISEELATYNGLEVGDEIVLVNPNQEEEEYTFSITGIYSSTETADSAGNMMSGFSAAFDSANLIYTSYDNLKSVAEASAENAVVTTDEYTGMESSTELRTQQMGTDTFADVESYEAFKEETEAELGDSYTVTSNDVTVYEQSLLPLENLSRYAGYFLAVILIIGGIILIVFNIFQIRERKYEIGVLAAIGMKKVKIAVQFILELLVVTFAAIIIGTGIGAVASVPITNQLLAKQVEAISENAQEQTRNFGREAGMSGGKMGMMQGGDMAPARDTEATLPEVGMFGSNTYISQISSATDWTVALQLVGIGILLTILSGVVAVISILRYDPLRILSSR